MEKGRGRRREGNTLKSQVTMSKNRIWASPTVSDVFKEVAA